MEPDQNISNLKLFRKIIRDYFKYLKNKKDKLFYYFTLILLGIAWCLIFIIVLCILFKKIII